MAYKFLPAFLSIPTSPKETYLADFQAMLDQEFYNAPNWFTIKEEYPYASGEYQDVDVRITHVINNRTGDKLGDDYKAILFKDISHATDTGFLYFFDDNYWIVIFTEIKRNIAATATIRRCNNTLRWRDKDGKYYSVPCAIEYLIKENRDYSTAGTNLVIPSGFLEITTQFNSISNKIRPNHRFLFGNEDNWTAYKVLGGGVNNYLNRNTLDNQSVGLLRISLGTNFINEDTDDLINGVADVYQYIYTLKIDQKNISGNIGDLIQLKAIVKVNSDIVDRNVIWSSSDQAVATVDSNGLVTLLSNGSCTINCHLELNETINDSSTIDVISTPIQNYQIVVTPSVNSIFQGDTEIFDVRLSLDGVILPDTFVFTFDNNGVPGTYYEYAVLNGNQFSIKNKKLFMNKPLKIKCVSGINEKILDILLKGAY